MQCCVSGPKAPANVGTTELARDCKRVCIHTGEIQADSEGCTPLFRIRIPYLYTVQNGKFGAN